MSVNPNEAPEGYIAIQTQEPNKCEGCAFFIHNIRCTLIENVSPLVSCISLTRADKSHVIFKETT